MQLRKIPRVCRGAAVLEALPAHTAAYLAGLVDGDGSIYLSRRKKLPTWILTVQLGGVGIEFVRSLHAECGSPGCVNVRTPKSSKRKKCAIWTMVGLTAVTFLKAVRPWLRLKREQAETAIAFHSISVEGGRPGERRYTELQQHQRYGLAAKMQKLNSVTGHAKVTREASA